MKSWIFALALLFPISASAQIISPLGMLQLPGGG
jgi:hypothetical protein